MTHGYAYGHGKHSYTCTCGKTVVGNGGKSAHKAMHQRRGDGHHFLTAIAACEQRAEAPDIGSRWRGWGKTWRVASVENGTALLVNVAAEHNTLRVPFSQFRTLAREAGAE